MEIRSVIITYVTLFFGTFYAFISRQTGRDRQEITGEKTFLDPDTQSCKNKSLLITQIHHGSLTCRQSKLRHISAVSSMNQGTGGKSMT